MTLLDAVTEARTLRDLAVKEYARAIVRASESGESLRRIGRAAGITFSAVRYILIRERGDTKK